MKCFWCEGEDLPNKQEATCFFFGVPMCDEHDRESRRPFDLTRGPDGKTLTCDHCGQEVHDRIHICFDGKT